MSAAARALHSIAEINQIVACSVLGGSAAELSSMGAGDGDGLSSAAAAATAAQTARRRFSLAQQASFEKNQIECLKRRHTLRRRRELEQSQSDESKLAYRLNDEGILLLSTAEPAASIRFAILLSLKGDIAGALPAALATLERHRLIVSHLESRKVTTRHKVNNKLAQNGDDESGALKMEVLAECDGTKENVVACIAAMPHDAPSVADVSIFKLDRQDDVPWYPRHVSELDKCSNCVTKYEPTTDPRHPGHGDTAYIARRDQLNRLAVGFKHGDAIPFVEYTEAEHAMWRAVFERLESLHPTLACETYRRNLQMLVEQGVLTKERIPQLRDINSFLERRTGFMLRPCSGLLSARDFLASLAFRVFQATTYVRHSASPHHSPEPDLVHELLGHVPMFADGDLAQLSQDIGLMSLGATDEQIEQLATVYWFIVEFGLCREGGQLKAIGAGLLSAYGELQHACSDVPEHRDFEPRQTALQKYEDDDYQPLYYVADGIQDALLKLRQFARALGRPFNVVYDPYTRSITEIRRVEDLDEAMSRFKLDFSAINTAIHLLPGGRGQGISINSIF